MKLTVLGAALAAAAAFACALPAAAADNYPIRDGSGTAQTFCSKEIGGVQYPCHIKFGLDGTTPRAITVDSAGRQGVVVNSGTVSLTGTLPSFAENPTFNLGGAIPPGSNTIGTVNLGGSLPAGSNTLGTVNLGILGGAATAANQVQPKVEDAPHTTGDTGAAVWSVRKDTATQLAGSDGDYAPFITDGSGRLWVNCGTGCSGGTQFAEDAAHTSGDLGTLSLGVRQDTTGALAGASGDYQPMIFDASGRLWTNVGTAANFATVGGVTAARMVIYDASGNPVDWTAATPITDGGGSLTVDGAVTTDAIAATGAAAPAKASLSGAVSSGNLVGIIQADTSVKIDVSTATTTQLVALSSGKKIYVTAWDVIAAGAGNLKLVYGTGTSCGTGTTDLTGNYSLTAQTGLTKGGGLGPVLVVPAGQALCVVTSAAITYSGSLAFTQF